MWNRLPAVFSYVKFAVLIKFDGGRGRRNLETWTAAWTGEFWVGIHWRSIEPNAQRKTELSWTVQFSSVQFLAVHWTCDDSATKLAVVAGASLSRHNFVNRPINAVSVVGQKPATTSDGRRLFLIVKIVAGSVHSGKLNWTQLNWTERSSWVELSWVEFCFPLCIRLKLRAQLRYTHLLL